MPRFSPHRLLLAAAVASCLSVAAMAQTTATRFALADRIDEVLDDDDFAGARWGVYVEDLATGDVLYARSPSDGFIPASNMKLVTTAAALDVLGPEFRFETQLLYEGDIAFGTLDGRLVIRGNGDPRFGGRYSGNDLSLVFRQWAGALQEIGVQRVQGAIIVTDDVMESPDTYFVRRMRRVFRQEGVDVIGDTVRVAQGGLYPGINDLPHVATHTSPPLASFVSEINTESNNLFAERTLRTVASYVFPTSGPVRPELRRQTADALLRRFGVDPWTFVVDDGSGLSRRNRMTPVGTVGLLRGMWTYPDPAVRDAFVESLPVGGYTGTLERRYRTGDARGNVRAKTGYVRRVRTLSGYVTTAAGRELAFSLMCNGYRVSVRRVNRAQDAVVELLADHVGRPRDTSRRRTWPQRRSEAARSG